MSQQQNNRPSSRVSNSRPSSSLSHSTGQSISILRPISSFSLNHPKTPSSSTRFGGLAEKDLQKITSSIRTAVKTTGTNYRPHHRPHQHRDVSDILEAGEREPPPEGSFLSEERSFSKAPLGSRLPPVSPHRVTSSSSATAAARRTLKGKGKRVQRVDDEDDEDEDDGGGGERILGGGINGVSDDDESSFDDDEDEDEERVETRLRPERVEKESLEGLGDDLQEALIVEDLLAVLMGIEGQYIEFDEDYNPEDEFERLNGARFVVDPILVSWLKDLVAGFLPIARYYTATLAFVEQYSVLEYGVINHALCAAIREMLRDYSVLLVQLEHQFLTSPTFSLRTMWYYLNPTLQTLSLLHTLTSALVVLNVAPDFSSSGSSNAGDDEVDSDDDIQDEGLRAMAREMKAAAKGINATTRNQPGGSTWHGGIAKGGEVLSVLYEKLETTSGDPLALKLYSNLLLRSSQPYVAIILGWISTGQLSDPWEEFIVKEAKNITRTSLDDDYMDEYWEKRYTLRDNGAKSPGRGILSTSRGRGLAGGAVIPAFLEPWKNKILLAGKYLNVIRECGIEIKSPDLTAVDGYVALNDEAFYRRIDEAYTYANKLLLQMLLTEQLLLSRLQSIKRYFFLDPADVFTHFLDMAQGELVKKSRVASVSKLQSMLELALRNPSSASDPFKDDLTITLHKTTLIDWLVKVSNVNGVMGNVEGYDALGTGLMEEKRKEDTVQDEKTASLLASDALTLDYAVRFPLNLVISKKTILRYQLIFRYLLQLKIVERALAEAWKDQTKTPIWRKRSTYREVEMWKTRVCSLRQRMLAFIQQMYSFAVGEVLEPNWRFLESKLEKVETVDQLLKDHVDFLDTCLNALLLTANEKILQLLNKLITVCALFTSYSTHFTRSITLAITTADARGEWNAATFKKQWDFLSKFEDNFFHHSKLLLERVGFTASRENTALLPLHVRLTNLRLGEKSS